MAFSLNNKILFHMKGRIDMKTGNNHFIIPESEEYENQALEASLMQSIINMRKALNLTQKELSERSGIHQADISKFENGSRKPSLKLIQRLAHSMNMEFKIELIHKK